MLLCIILAKMFPSRILFPHLYVSWNVFRGSRCLVFVQLDPDHPGSPPFWNKVYECVNIFTIQIEYTANRNRQTLSQSKPWCNDSGALNLHHGYYPTIMTSRKLFRHNPVSRGTNHPIGKSELVQCMKFE